MMSVVPFRPDVDTGAGEEDGVLCEGVRVAIGVVDRVV